MDLTDPRGSKEKTRSTVQFTQGRLIDFFPSGQSIVFDLGGFIFTLKQLLALSRTAEGGIKQASNELAINYRTVEHHLDGIKDLNAVPQNEEFDEKAFAEKARQLGLLEQDALDRLQKLHDRFVGMSLKSE